MRHQAEHGKRSGQAAAADPLLVEKVLTGLDIGIYVTDAQEHIVSVNPRAEEILRWSAALLVGSNAHDALHRSANGTLLPPQECKLTQDYQHEFTIRAGSAWFMCGDGGLLPVVWLVAPYRLENGDPGTAVLFHERVFDPEMFDTYDPDHVAALTANLSLISATTTVLTSHVEIAEALRQVVQLVLPRLADWAIVDLIDEHGHVRRAAAIHYHDNRHVRVEELEGSLPPVPPESQMPLSRVLKGAPVSRISPEDYSVPPDTEMAVVQRRLFATTGMHSAIAAPLRGRGGSILGALTLGRSKERPDFTSTEITLVDDIAHQAGLALDYEQQRRVAETMQRYLLPQLPCIPGLEMEARYYPAPQSSRVGGDWYDAFTLADGTLTMVLGDVTGHDLRSAAQMAEIRSMLRAFAWDHTSTPGEIVSRLDQALVTLDGPTMATLIFARLERTADSSWQLAWTNAGHPPPLLLDRDGHSRFLDAENDPLLGVVPFARRQNFTTTLTPSTTVVFYSDGLVESAARPIDTGLESLRDHAARLAHSSLADLCDGLISRVRAAGHDDDVALLALRVTDPQMVPCTPKTQINSASPT